MEEAAFLMAVQRIVGGVEVVRDLLGRRGMGLEEQIDEKPFNRRTFVADLVTARWCRARQFQPVQRRIAATPRSPAASPQACRKAACQFALNRDPHFAANSDPFVMM